MTSLTKIARTISDEFTKAVEAALRADAQETENILQAMNEAYSEQQRGLAAVEEIEKQVALLVRESIDLRSKVDNKFYEAMTVFRTSMGAMKGSKLQAPVKLKAIEGAGK